MMTANEQPTLKIVSGNFEGYELVLGVADSHIQALRIAARYRKFMRNKGWRFEKMKSPTPLTYLEFHKMGATSRITFEFEDCTLNKGIYDDETK